MDRAYALVTVKTVDEDARLIAGIASTMEVDRVGDVVDPSGARFAASVPLLLHHDSRLPVGSAILKRSADGLTFNARIPKIDEPGTLKSRVDEAWQSIKAGLIKGVSIGFRAAEDGFELMKNGGLKFTDFEVLELSLVAIPANASASIQAIKSYSEQVIPAAIAAPKQATAARPAATSAGSRQERMTVKSITEQIKDYAADRAAKSARMTELMEAAAKDGVTLDAQQSEEYDRLESETKAIDAHLSRLDRLEEQNKAAAVEVKATNPIEAAQSRASMPVISVRENAAPGIGMARVVICKLASYLEFRKGNFVSAAELAQKHYRHDPRVVQHIQKTAVAGGTTTDTNWATELVEPTTLASEFVEYLRHQTIIGKLNLRRMPFNVRVPRQTTAGAGSWVGEGKPKPLTKFHFDAVTLPYTKVASIAVITQELARFSQPSAEAIVRDQLVAACRERIDTDLIDPDKAVSSGVNPASLTNGVTALSSSGVAAANVITDVQNLLEQFILNRQDPSNVVLVMPNTLALAASLMITTNGVQQFPGLTMNGGTLLGIPVITSQYAASGASYGNMIVAIDQSAVGLADDGNFSVDISTEASLQMDDAPSNDATTGTGQSLVSMFQTNSIAIRAEREIHWVKLRSTAVSFMDDVNWGSIGSPA